MSKFTNVVKGVVGTSVKLVNRAATSVADATRFKLSEMDAISRRREAITELGEKVYGLFQNGAELPEELLPLANELRALEEGLETLRANRNEQKAAAAQKRADERAAKKAAKKGTPVMEREPEVEEAPAYDGEAPTLEIPVEAEAEVEVEDEPVTL